MCIKSFASEGVTPSAVHVWPHVRLPLALTVALCSFPLMCVSVLSIESGEPNCASEAMSEPGPLMLRTPSFASPTSTYTPESSTITLVMVAFDS